MHTQFKLRAPWIQWAIHISWCRLDSMGILQNNNIECSILYCYNIEYLFKSYGLSLEWIKIYEFWFEILKSINLPYIVRHYVLAPKIVTFQPSSSTYQYLKVAWKYYSYATIRCGSFFVQLIYGHRDLSSCKERYTWSNYHT